MARPINMERIQRSHRKCECECEFSEAENWPAVNRNRYRVIADQRKFQDSTGCLCRLLENRVVLLANLQTQQHCSRLMCEAIDGAMMKQQDKHRRCLLACCSDRPNPRSLREILRIDSIMVGPCDDLLKSLSHFSLRCLNA